ncbi:hypothetical protein VTK56DRAFT_9623 [Thermocarpiscus australiensis]
MRAPSNSTMDDSDSKTCSQHPVPNDETNEANPKSPEKTTEHRTSTESTTAEMPPGGKQRPNPPRREADLSLLLDPGDKIEVTALINKVTDSMQKHVTQLFDPASTNGNDQPSRITFWNKLPYYLKDLSLNDPISESQKRGNQKEAFKAARSKKAGRAADNFDSVPNAGGTASQGENDVGPRLQELKKEALLHFKKWQTAVHRRIADISAKKGPDAGRRRGPSFNRKDRSSGRC